MFLAKTVTTWQLSPVANNHLKSLITCLRKWRQHNSCKNEYVINLKYIGSITDLNVTLSRVIGLHTWAARNNVHFWTPEIGSWIRAAKTFPRKPRFEFFTIHFALVFSNQQWFATRLYVAIQTNINWSYTVTYTLRTSCVCKVRTRKWWTCANFLKHAAHAKPSSRKLGHWDYMITSEITRKSLNTSQRQLCYYMHTQQCKSFYNCFACSRMIYFYKRQTCWRSANAWMQSCTTFFFQCNLRALHSLSFHIM